MGRSITLEEADAFITTALRDEDKDSYTPTDRTNAVNWCVQEFCRISLYLRGLTTVTFKAGDSSFDMTSAVNNASADDDDFGSDRLMSAYLTDDKQPIKTWDFDSITHQLWLFGTTNTKEKPEAIGWQTRTQGLVYPPPTADINAVFVYRKMHPRLVEGGDVIEIDEDVIIPALMWGVPAVLRFAGREELAASPMWLQFLRVAQEAKAQPIDQGVAERAEEEFF